MRYRQTSSKRNFCVSEMMLKYRVINHLNKKQNLKTHNSELINSIKPLTDCLVILEAACIVFLSILKANPIFSVFINVLIIYFSAIRQSYDPEIAGQK